MTKSIFTVKSFKPRNWNYEDDNIRILKSFRINKNKVLLFLENFSNGITYQMDEFLIFLENFSSGTTYQIYEFNESDDFDDKNYSRFSYPITGSFVNSRNKEDAEELFNHLVKLYKRKYKINET